MPVNSFRSPAKFTNVRFLWVVIVVVGELRAEAWKKGGQEERAAV